MEKQIEKMRKEVARIHRVFYQMLIAETKDVILYNFNPIEYKLFGVPLVIDKTIKNKYFEIDYIY